MIEIDCAPLRTVSARAAAEKRSRQISAEGYRIIRFWADHIDSHLEGALAIIDAALIEGARGGRHQLLAAAA